MSTMHWIINRRLMTRLILLVAVVLSSSLSVSAQDAEPITIRPELIDSIIEIRGQNYVLDHADLEEYPHGRGERIYISSLESKGFAELSFFDDEDSPEETIAVMLSEFESAASAFELLEDGSEENVHYALAYFVLPGYQGYFYIEVAQDVDGNVDIQQNFYNLNSDFSEQLALVRDDVTIDGIPFLQSPAIEVDRIVAEHRAAQDILAATPVVETVELQQGPVTVTSPVRSYDHFTSDVLECVFFTTSTGNANGLVGYLRNDEPNAEDVVRTIASDVPTGEIPPEEIEIRTEGRDQATGLYLVTSREGIRLMVISVSWHGEGLWQIESLAAPPDLFLTEYAEVEGRVTIDGRSMFADIDIEAIIDDADLAP